MTMFHMCMSVRGVLNWSPAETKRHLAYITKNDGTSYASVREFRDEMMDELSRGHEVIPFGEPCDGFDYKTGCPGHVQAEAPDGEPSHVGKF